MHLASQKTRTAAEARLWLQTCGISAREFARMQGVHWAVVAQVLSGRRRCLRGKSHRVAVALGMKIEPKDKPE